MSRSLSQIGAQLFGCADQIDAAVDLLRALPKGEITEERMRLVSDSGLLKMIPVMLDLYKIADELIRKDL
jgi:hypothetical protein